MNTYPKVDGDKAWLVQAICREGYHGHTLIKATLVGVKESVKAVSATLLGSKSVMFTGETDLCFLRSDHDPVRLCQRQLAPVGYSVGSIWHPDLLENIVCGSPEELAARSFRVFKKALVELPVIEEFAPVLWEIALLKDYAKEVFSFGLPPGEKAYLLRVPDAKDLEEDLLPYLPRLTDIAAALA